MEIRPKGNAICHVVNEEDEVVGLRFDVAMAVLFPDFSRSKLAKGITEGVILRNGKSEKPKTPILLGDVLTWDPSFYAIAPLHPENFTLPVLYEDDDVMVINKPAGIVTHPTETLREGTVVNELMGSGRSLAPTDDPNRPGIVHRLDAQTSGCLIVAKTSRAYEELGKSFRAHEVKKHYLAIVEGKWETEGILVQEPIGRDPKNPKRRWVRADGRMAKSFFVTREAQNEASLMDVRIFTGRTHQIRVHSAYQNHPVIGDSLYGYRKQRHRTAHQLLHAWQIGFFHPISGKWLHILAPWDEEFTRCLKLFHFSIPDAQERELFGE